MRAPVITREMLGDGFGWETWQGYYDVRDGGADPTGVRDSTVEIRAIIEAAIASNKPIYFSPGRYRVSGELVRDETVKIFGESMMYSIIDCTGYAGTVFDLAEYSEVSDLKIYGGDRATGASAIESSSNWYSCKLKNLFISNIGTAIFVKNTWGSSLTNILCVNVGMGVYLTKFNGGRIDSLTVNNHILLGLALSDSRGWVCNSIVLENGIDSPEARLKLQGCECGTVDGLYIEGTSGDGSYDILISSKAGVGASENIIINNVWMNGNDVTNVSSINIAAGDNILLSNFHWHTPLNTYYTTYIDTNITGSDNYVHIKNWTREDGDVDIPLGTDHTHIIVDELDTDLAESMTFLTVPDAAGKYPVFMGGTTPIIGTLANDALPSVAGGHKWLTGGTETIIGFAHGFEGQTLTIISKHATPFAFGLAGNHDGGNGELTVMTDSGEAFVPDSLIGLTINNTTDGSSGVITDNDATTVTVAALAGGADNDWDTGDAWTIDTYLEGSTVNIATASGDVTQWICEGGTTWRLTAFVDESVDNSAGA